MKRMKKDDEVKEAVDEKMYKNIIVEKHEVKRKMHCIEKKKKLEIWAKKYGQRK